MVPIENHELVTRIFGKWPSFHDAEVVWLRLDREGQTLGLLFRQVEGLDLGGFNEQNVLFELTITEASGDSGQPQFDVVFWPCYGVSAAFSCRSVSVLSVTPFDRG